MSCIAFVFSSTLCVTCLKCNRLVWYRANAEQALSMLNNTLLGGQNIRLSWGRSPSSKQVFIYDCIF